MNIIQVTRRFVRHEWGGVETAVLETAKQLKLTGHTTEIYTSAALSRPGTEAIDSVTVRRFKHMYPYWGLSANSRLAMDKKGGNLFSLPLLRGLQQAPGLDAIHVHTLNRLGGIVRYVAKQRRIPYIVSIHGGVHDLPAAQSDLLRAPSKGAFEWGKVLGWWFGSRQVLSDADAIVCFGRTEWELTRRQFPDVRVELMPHGVDVERFAQGESSAFRAAHNIPVDAQVMLCMARIDPQKDQLLTVTSLPKILLEAPTAHLVLMGPVTDVHYASQLKQTARDLGVQDRVRFVPGVPPEDPSLVDAFYAADIFVLPSMHEVFGIVVLEAWAAGLPVVASNIGGIKSLVENGRDGLLFEQGDEDEFVRHCCKLLTNAELTESLRHRAKQRVEVEFNWQTVANQMAQLYGEVKREHAAAC